MSWLFSRALVEEFSAANCLDGEPSAQLNENPTPQAYLSPDRMTAFSRLSRFGMTFAPLTELHGADVLTWFLGGFPVKTFQPLEKALESTANEADYGAKWRGSLAKYDPATHSLKTAQRSLNEEWSESLLTLPALGLMLDGECFQVNRLVLPLKGSGFLLPAPTKSMAARGWGISNVKRRYSQVVESNARLFGYKPHPSVLEWSMGWIPTWTRLAPLEMGKFQLWQQQHGECLEAHE